MNRYMESLEGRTLCSATPTQLWADEMQLAADSRATITALRAVIPAVRTDMLAVRTDILKLPLTKTNLLLMAKLQVDQIKASVTLIQDYAMTVAIGMRAINKLFADGVMLKLMPTSEIIQAKVQADLVAFQAASAGPSAKLAADMTAFGTTIAADVAALVAANPTATQLATDVQKFQTDAVASLAPVQAALAQGGTDLAKLVTDLTT
jgi:hypothetical protein